MKVSWFYVAQSHHGFSPSHVIALSPFPFCRLLYAWWRLKMRRHWLSPQISPSGTSRSLLQQPRYCELWNAKCVSVPFFIFTPHVCGLIYSLSKHFIYSRNLKEGSLLMLTAGLSVITIFLLNPHTLHTHPTNFEAGLAAHLIFLPSQQTCFRTGEKCCWGRLR